MTTAIRYPARSSAGFTLVELMVTVLVASILLTIASSMYMTQIRQSRRTEAKTAVLDLAAREERFFSTRSAYTTTPSDLGYTGTFPMTVGSGYYTINVTQATTADFTATATTTGSQTSDTTCTQFTVNNTGVQTATSSTCWN